LLALQSDSNIGPPPLYRFLTRSRRLPFRTQSWQGVQPHTSYDTFTFYRKYPNRIYRDIYFLQGDL
jgi:hypothetical protein